MSTLLRVLPLALFAIPFACSPSNQQTAANTPNANPSAYPQPYPTQGYPQPYPTQGYPQPYPTQGQPQPYPTQGYPQPYPTQPQPYPTATQPYPLPTATQPYPQPTGTQPAPTATSPFPFPIPSGLPLPFPTATGTATGAPGPGPGPGLPGNAPTGPAATPIDPTFATAATLPLQAFAQTEAPGMQREGALAAANFQEGQILEQALNLQPGKCYAVLAVGIGIQEVDITLATNLNLPGLTPILARDSGSGSQSSLGGKGNCYRVPVPVSVPAKYIVRATKGSGLAAAAVFVK